MILLYYLWFVFFLFLGEIKKGRKRDLKWAWLFDMQCTIGIVIGKAMHHGLTTVKVCEEEKLCQDWLSSVLVQNGVEEREKIRGYFSFVLIIFMLCEHVFSCLVICT